MIEEKRQEASSPTDPAMQDNEEAPVAKARKPPPGPTTEELDKHEHSRTLCSVPGADTVFRVGHGKIHIDASQHTRVGHPISCWIGCSLRVIKNRVFNCPCPVVYDLSTGAVMATQSTTDLDKR